MSSFSHGATIFEIVVRVGPVSRRALSDGCEEAWASVAAHHRTCSSCVAAGWLKECESTDQITSSSRELGQGRALTVDDKVAALLDEAEPPAQLANHLRIHRGVSYMDVCCTTIWTRSNGSKILSYKILGYIRNYKRFCFW